MRQKQSRKHGELMRDTTLFIFALFYKTQIGETDASGNVDYKLYRLFPEIILPITRNTRRDIITALLASSLSLIDNFRDDSCKIESISRRAHTIHIDSQKFLKK